MTQQEYEQKRRECWEKYSKEFYHITQAGIPKSIFYGAFDRAYALGKQEKDEEETKTDDCVTISLHVAVIPRQEEFYMGVDASHEAYMIDIPQSMIPSNLLAVINGECQNKLVTNIAIMK